MKPFFSILLFTTVLFSCTNGSEKDKVVTEKKETEKQHFFPVTAYIKGEMYTIKQNGINPLKYTTIADHTDSVWLKIEDLDAAVAEFLQPEIDSANLLSMFTEKSFLDQSINAVTLTYEPFVSLPDSMKLRHWDVYLDPTTNKVKRIYMVKEISKTKTLQLTWVNDKWCKITSIITDGNGVSGVEKEEKITWDF